MESIPQEVTEVGVADDLDSAAVAVDFVDFSGETAPRNDLMQEIGSLTGSGLDGRGSAAARKALVRSAGGSEGSEKAVAAALKWLAAVQLPDGGWNFDHRLGPANRNAVRIMREISARPATARPRWPCYRFSERARRTSRATTSRSCMRD